MAHSALAELLIRLMNMTAIALLMVRKTRRGAFGGLMTRVALWGLGLPGHLLWVHVLFVREAFYSELAHFGRKTYPGSLGVKRRLMTYNAHLTRTICKIFCVTLYASRVTGENRRDVVVQSLMAKGAILGFGLVLGASVIERRGALDHLGFLNVEGRRSRSRLRRGLRRFGGLVGSRLLCALASHCADESNRRRSDYDKS